MRILARAEAEIGESLSIGQFLAAALAFLFLDLVETGAERDAVAGHRQGGVGELRAAVQRTLAAGDGLLAGVRHDDAVDHRDFGTDGRVLEGLGRGVRDDLVVLGVAGDDDAQGDDAVVITGHGRHVGREGNLAGAGDGDLDDRGGGHAGGAQAFDGVLLQGLDQLAIVTRRHEGEAEFGAIDGVRGGLV